MGRHLTVGSAIDVTKVASDTPWIELIEIEVVDEGGSHIDWLRACKNNENITFNGNLYQAADFKLSSSGSVGEEPRLSIDFSDPTGIIRQALNAYEGGADFPVTYRVVNASALDKPAEIEELFIIQSSTVSGDFLVNITLGVDGALAKKFPVRAQYPDRCSFVYKDSRCGYTGGIATCDYSLEGTNGCIAHANQARFGGFPGLVQR